MPTKMCLDELLGITKHTLSTQPQSLPDLEGYLRPDKEGYFENSTLSTPIQQTTLPIGLIRMPDDLCQIGPRNRLCARHEYHLLGHRISW